MLPTSRDDHKGQATHPISRMTATISGLVTSLGIIVVSMPNDASSMVAIPRSGRSPPILSPVGTMLACDFFHVDCALTLRRMYVFFVIEVNPRDVHLVGATSNPDGHWTTQQARDLLADLGERAASFTCLVRDRGGQFTTSFDAVLADAEIRVVRIPPRCPQANGYAERFVRTVRSELTDQMLIFGRRHLMATLSEYVEHYNTQRPHRGQRLRPPKPQPIPDVPNIATIHRHPVVGGFVNEYHQAA